MKLGVEDQALGEGGTRRRYMTSIHLTRAVGILLIVATHCWPGIPWSAWVEDRILPLFFRSSTVFLVFISGFMFKYVALSGELSLGQYMVQRLPRILIPYIVVSLPILAVILFVHQRSDVWPWVYRMPPWEQVVVFLVTGKHISYLWYLPALTILILLSGVFGWIDRNNLYWLFVPSLAIVATILGRDGFYGIYSILSKTLFITPSYLLGMYFCNIYVCNRYKVSDYVLYMCLTISALITLVYVVFGGMNLNYLWLQKISLAVICIRILDTFEIKGSWKIVWGCIAGISFSIYFLHGYAINFLRLIYSDEYAVALFGGSAFSKIVYLLAKVLIVTLLSAAGCLATRFVFGDRSRYLVGA